MADQQLEETVPDADDVTGPSDDDASREEDEAAEHEHATQPEQPEDQPEAQGATEVEWERRFTKGEKRFETYRKAIFDLWEEDALDLIPFSISPSAPPGFISKADAGRVPEEIQRATFEFFGLAREQDYEADPETTVCPSCKGKTKTKTGAVSGGFTTRACPTCKARGYVLRDGRPDEVPTNGHTDEAFTLTSEGVAAVADKDNWGEPRFLPDGTPNENFGRQPQYKVDHPVYGRTADLTVQAAAGGA